MNKIFSCAVLILIIFSYSSHSQQFPSTVGYDVKNATSYTLVAKSNESSLYNVNVDTNYGPPIQLAVIKGATRFQMGKKKKKTIKKKKKIF